MEPQYFAVFLYVCYEAFVVCLLVSPMPNNKIRGALTMVMTQTWKKHPWFRNTHWVMLSINIYLFYASMHDLHAHPSEHNIELVTCEGMLMKMVLQRNAYITGFGIFLFCIMQRLLDIQMQLHKSRVALKQLQATVRPQSGSAGHKPAVQDTWDEYVYTEDAAPSAPPLQSEGKKQN